MKRSPIKRHAKSRGRGRAAIETDIWRHGMDADCFLADAECDGRIDAHHIVYAQHLRKYGLHNYLLDHRNRISLCRHHHDQHHNRSNPVPFDLLPHDAIVFAAEMGLTYLVERLYPRKGAE